MEEETVIKVEVDELTIEPINGKVIDLENSDLSVGKIVFKKKELPTKWEDLDTSIINSSASSVITILSFIIYNFS